MSSISADLQSSSETDNLRVISNAPALTSPAASLAGFGRKLDRVNYLYVAGAAAVMHAENAVDLIVGWVGGFVYEVFGANHDPRCAKATLESACGDK